MGRLVGLNDDNNAPGASALGADSDEEDEWEYTDEEIWAMMGKWCVHVTACTRAERYAGAWIDGAEFTHTVRCPHETKRLICIDPDVHGVVYNT